MAEVVLDIRKLSRRFGALQACDEVCIDLRHGEIHALIGPNGAGKSTLISQIAGELPSDSGSVHFCGQDITRLDAASRAKRGLARSFQVSSLALDFTALQNTLLAVQGASGSTFRFFRPALSETGQVDKAMGFLARTGLQDLAEKPASDLSHGQRRQLEISMALALQPKAFLLDEPMAGMGPEGSKILTGFLDGLRQDAPILLVEHDMDAVFALADRISVLVYGRIIATGSVQEIRTSAQVREAYLGTGPT
jgi:branched-chain amino acid transport system ATP-binding protein